MNRDNTPETDTDELPEPSSNPETGGNEVFEPFVNPDPLFEVITGRPMPDFDKKRRTVYPFDDMKVRDAFLAGKANKGLKGRLYSAIHARKKNHPTEKYSFEVMDNGDLYVWKVQA